jgi:hypothetical protein
MTDKPTAQINKFRDLARELECDEDEPAFDERLKKLAKARAPKAGFWRVEFPVGEGRVQARFHPDDPDGERWSPSPAFNSTVQAHAWLREQNCRQDLTDPDKWYD